MRTLIKGYTFTAGTRSIDCSNSNPFDIENIRLIVNETQKVVLCSSMQKDLIVSIVDGVITYTETLPVLADGDKLTIELDKGENDQSSIAVLSEITEGKKDISDAIILKGGMASDIASFAELADNIGDIPNFNLYGTTWQAGYEPTSAFEVCNNKTLYLTEINNTIVQNVDNYAFQYCSNITALSLPAAQTIGNYAFQSCTNITTLSFGKLTSFSSSNTFAACYKLSNIIIGVDTNINLDFSSLSHATWNANIDATVWNENFVSGIINNLFDFTSGAAHTIKVGAYPYAKLTPETIALAAAKNWNITA